MNDWISVKEQLPEDIIKAGKKQIKVLVYMKCKKSDCIRTQLRYKDWHGEWVWKSSEEVTHWMPLPEPPKEDI